MLRGEERGDQRARLVRRHFVQVDTSGVHRDIRPASGDQPSAGLLASGKKRLEVRFLPNIIDNEEAVTILELFPELKHGLRFVQKTRLVASQRLVELNQSTKNVRVLAERHPKDSVVEGSDDFIVMTQREGKCCLAIAASTFYGGGDRDRVLPFFVQDLSDELLKFQGPPRAFAVDRGRTFGKNCKIKTV